MSLIRDLVKEIRKIIACKDPLDTENLTAIVKAYEEKCKQINERIYRCLDLLRKGRRKEAIILSQQEPALRQEVREMNFREKQEWLDFCEKHDIDIEQQVDRETFSSISPDISTEDKSLDRLLNLHRRLALSRAPLEMRLRILRQIRWIDTERQYWRDDLQAYEAARIEELKQQASEADRQGNLHVLETTLAELQSEEWQQPPSANLIKSLKKLIIPHRREFAYRRFEELAEQLRHAQNHAKDQSCQRLLADWQNVIEETGIEPPPEFRQQIEPIRQWLTDVQTDKQEEDAYQQACATLERALDQEQNPTQLENLAAAVLRFERGMPGLLGARFKSRAEELERKEKTKFWLRLTAMVICVIVIAVVSTIVVRWRQHSNQFQRWQQQIQAALDVDDHQQADKLLTTLAENNPKMYSAPEIVELQTVYETKVQQEKLRKQQFEKQMAKVVKAGVEFPATAALREAATLAKTFDEKVTVDQWRQKTDSFAQKERRRRDRKFEQRLVKLEQLYAELRSAAQGEQKDLNLQINECLDFARDLVAVDDVSSELKKRAHDIYQSTNKIAKKTKERATKKIEIRRSLQQITDLYNNPEKLPQQLKDFAKKYPEHPLAEQFVLSERLASHWKAADAWSKIVKSWQSRIRSDDPAVIRARLQQVNVYLESYNDGPYQQVVTESRAYLKAAQKAVGDQITTQLASINTVVNNPLLADALVLWTADEQAFYMLKDTLHKNTAQKGSSSFEYIIDSTYATKTATIRTRSIKKKPQPSPQIKFSQEARKLIRQYDGTDWETLFLRMAKLVQDNSEIDSILRANLLKMLLEISAEFAASGAQQIRKMTACLDDIDIDVPWMDPEDSDANLIRGQVKRILEDMAPLDDLIRNIEQQLSTLDRSLCTYTPVGILLGQTDGVKLAKPVDKADLYVIYSDKKDTKPVFRKVGAMLKNKTTIDQKLLGQCPLGSPLFIRSTTPARL